MFAIEFEAHLRQPSIQIPAEQWEQLRSQVNGEPVRVIVLTRTARDETVRCSPLTRNGKSLSADAESKGYDNFIAYLIDHPVEVVVPVPLAREDIYVRRNF